MMYDIQLTEIELDVLIRALKRLDEYIERESVFEWFEERNTRKLFTERIKKLTNAKLP